VESNCGAIQLLWAGIGITTIIARCVCVNNGLTGNAGSGFDILGCIVHKIVGMLICELLDSVSVSDRVVLKGRPKGSVDSAADGTVVGSRSHQRVQ
jgi:hypothetical protein